MRELFHIKPLTKNDISISKKKHKIILRNIFPYKHWYF